MSRTPDGRRAAVVITAFVLLIAVGAAVVVWYSTSYLERAGGLREVEARSLCEDEVRWSTGVDLEDHVATGAARVDPEADQWIVDGQVSGDGFRCLVSGEKVSVEMLPWAGSQSLPST